LECWVAKEEKMTKFEKLEDGRLEELVKLKRSKQFISLLILVQQKILFDKQIMMTYLIGCVGFQHK
jgi:hypothetical protein